MIFPPKGCKALVGYGILNEQLFNATGHAVLAQEVERSHGKAEVAGSNPVDGSAKPSS